MCARDRRPYFSRIFFSLARLRKAHSLSTLHSAHTTHKIRRPESIRHAHQHTLSHARTHHMHVHEQPEIRMVYVQIPCTKKWKRKKAKRATAPHCQIERTPPMCPGLLKNYTIRFFNWKPTMKCTALIHPFSNSFARSVQIRDARNMYCRCLSRTQQ